MTEVKVYGVRCKDEKGSFMDYMFPTLDEAMEFKTTAEEDASYWGMFSMVRRPFEAGPVNWQDVRDELP